MEIGDRNRIRESVTIHRGTVQGGGLTKVGSDNLLMINAHIAHDCTVGNRCIGVEGAVVVSARARNKRDVGKATLLAVLSALGVYLLVTLLSLGVVARPELAEIRNPSMAGLMVEMMGPWGENDRHRATDSILQRWRHHPGRLIVRADRGSLLLVGQRSSQGWQGDIIPLR